MDEENKAFSYLQRDWPTAPSKEGLQTDTRDLIRAIEELKQLVPLIRQFATPEHGGQDPTKWLETRNFHFGREAALVITKLDEARMWAEQMLKVLEQV